MRNFVFFLLLITLWSSCSYQKKSVLKQEQEPTSKNFKGVIFLFVNCYGYADQIYKALYEKILNIKFSERTSFSNFPCKIIENKNNNNDFWFLYWINTNHTYIYSKEFYRVFNDTQNDVSRILSTVYSTNIDIMNMPQEIKNKVYIVFMEYMYFNHEFLKEIPVANYTAKAEMYADIYVGNDVHHPSVEVFLRGFKKKKDIGSHYDDFLEEFASNSFINLLIYIENLGKTNATFLVKEPDK